MPHLAGCEICTVYNVTDAEEFVEQWMAYSLTNFGGADPTVARLNEFQLKGFQKDQENTPAATDDYRPLPNKRSRGSNASSILNAYGFNDTAKEKVSDVIRASFNYYIVYFAIVFINLLNVQWSRISTNK